MQTKVACVIGFLAMMSSMMGSDDDYGGVFEVHVDDNVDANVGG